MTRINFILLGESGVGKTTLLNRFKTGEFKEYVPPTVSVEFQVKKIYVEGKEISLFLWDPSGQERYHGVVRSYYRKGEGVLLVYDVTDPTSFYKLSMWMKELKDANEEAQVLIAGNKNEDPSKKAVTVSMVKNFARDENLEYMEISALTGENVEKAFDYLLKKVLSVKGILSKNPNSTCTDVIPFERLPKKEKEVIKLGQTEETPKKKSSSCC